MNRPVMDKGFREEVMGFERVQAGSVGEDVRENSQRDLLLTDHFQHLGVAPFLDDDFEALDDLFAETAVGDFLAGTELIGEQLDRCNTIIFVRREFFEDFPAAESLKKDIETSVVESFFSRNPTEADVGEETGGSVIGTSGGDERHGDESISLQGI